MPLFGVQLGLRQFTSCVTWGSHTNDQSPDDLSYLTSRMKVSVACNERLDPEWPYSLLVCEYSRRLVWPLLCSAGGFDCFVKQCVWAITRELLSCVMVPHGGGVFFFFFFFFSMYQAIFLRHRQVYEILFKCKHLRERAGKGKAINDEACLITDLHGIWQFIFWRGNSTHNDYYYCSSILDQH